MNIDDIKKISLVEFLNQLGYQPTGRDSKGLWFYAPYRSERKPSFHVNPRKNVWFDFGSGDAAYWVDYELHGKRYYAVGFPNNANGLELRNPFFAGSYPPKHHFNSPSGNARCNVFEGFSRLPFSGTCPRL